MLLFVEILWYNFLWNILMMKLGRAMTDRSDNINRARAIRDELEASNAPQSVGAMLLDDAIGWIKLVIFTVVIAVALHQFVIINATVPTASMENTIMTNDRVIAFRLAYMFSEPERYDIIFFRYPGDMTQVYVKRVIGLPGETVDIIDGQVFINGSTTPLNDDFVRGPVFGNYPTFNVPEGSFFVLGDNRNNSGDSRDWIDPYVPRSSILGRAVLTWWNSFGFIS